MKLRYTSNRFFLLFPMLGLNWKGNKMGIIRIETNGSFGSSYKTFSAQDHGHAHAVNAAIIYLNELMRKSINNVHNCHDKNIRPSSGFNLD